MSKLYEHLLLAGLHLVCSLTLHKNTVHLSLSALHHLSITQAHDDAHNCYDLSVAMAPHVQECRHGLHLEMAESLSHQLYTHSRAHTHSDCLCSEA